ncbi:MAG: branched-chain amino acid ABC transporter permease/ATP-binding protein, partial [Actinomycetota bacterium]|nr:branched-chain amino acid ABC transporter permease/ATP-binding protein [Actinomycetota bacterium]
LGVLVLGLAAGSIFSLAATGLVLTFSTSGIVNFAHGAVAALGAYAFYELHQDLPWPPALLLSLLGVGGGAGLLLEAIARRIHDAALHLQVVATVAVVLVVQGAVDARYGERTLYAERFLPHHAVPVLGARVAADRLLLIAIGLLVVLLLQLLLRRTTLGTAMRAVVDDPVLLAETGTDPARVRRWAWVLGSTLAALSGVLLAPTVGLAPLTLTFLVVQAFGAAAVGRFTSVTGAYVGGLILGVASQLVSRYLAGITGLGAGLPFVVLLVVLLLAPPTALLRDTHGAAVLVGRVRWPVVAAAAAVLGLLPFLVGPRLSVFTELVALVPVLVGLSLMVNASGQVSLCQASLCAVGAAAASALLAAGVPWGLALLGAGLLVLPLGVVVAAPTAQFTGPALAVASFGFGLLLDKVLLPVLYDKNGTVGVARPAGAQGDRPYFWLVSAIALVVCVLVLLMLRGRPGSVLAALADDPVGLAATGISVLRVRVLVFGVAAFLAGIAGVLLAGVSLSATTAGLTPIHSLLWVAVLAIGGRGVVSAGVRAAIGIALVPYYLGPYVGALVTLLFGAVALAVALLRGASFAGLAARSQWRLERGPVQARRSW